MNRSVVEEIIALSPQRVQKVFGFFGHVLVLEMFSFDMKKLYLVFDCNPKTATLHVQRERPHGHKTRSPFIALLNKYILARTMRFFKLDEDGSAIKAITTVDDETFSLIFTSEPRPLAGLFRSAEIIGSMTPHDAPAFHAGYLITSHAAQTIDKNEAQASKHSAALQSFNQQTYRESRLAAIAHQISKAKRLLKNVQGDRAKCESALTLERDANLLKANMHLLKRGMKEALVTDYFSDPPAQKIINLDPKISPQDFLTKTFNKIKKARRGLSIISQRLLVIEEELDALVKKQATIAAGDETENSSIDEKIIARPHAAKNSAARLPFRKFLSSDNIAILVGKSARDSDALTKSARGNEWFFHARNATGAHVIVKTNDALPEKTMLEAALLAQHFSKDRDTATSLIQYTRVKYVQKKKGLAPGAVLITQEKTIEIVADSTLLNALLSRQT